jgi:hypothetical protein
VAGGLGDGGGKASLGDDSQVASLRNCGQPHAQVRNPSRDRPAGYRQNGSSVISSPIGGRSSAEVGVKSSIAQPLTSKLVAKASLASLPFTVPVFDPGRVAQDRFRSDPNRMLVAELFGEARHHARWRELSSDEEAAAVAALRELAGGRTDLLAEVAGIFEGTSEGELDEPLARCAADLCRKAGADLEAIPRWIDEGKRRAAAARKPPHGYL